MALSKLRSASFEDTAIYGNRNLIINGAMQIAQRGTSAVAASANYPSIDRFKAWGGGDGVFTVEQSTTAPAGFTTSLKAQVTTADTSMAAGQYAQLSQQIEAQNLQHLEYGTSGAKTLTLSFYVRSSKTGSYSITIYKSDSTEYLFSKSYTIDSADTWERKIITITPDSNIKASGGAIANDNGIGFYVFWNLAGGTNFDDATDNAWSSNTSHYHTSSQVNWMDNTSNNFYITGVQLEVGEQATPFEHRSFGDELSRCQRYYYKTVADSAADGFGNGNVNSTVRVDGFIPFKQTMRASPTAIETNGTAGDYRVNQGGANTTCNAVPTIIVATKDGCDTRFHVASGLTVGRGAVMRCVNSGAFLAWSAEL